MREPEVMDLARCSELSQVLAARPPRVVHGTLFLLTALLASGVAWSAATKVDLVVQAPVRVRPIT